MEFLLVFFVRVLVVRVVSAGCGWAACSHAQVHQDIGKPRHIWDRQKALDETSKTITFNYGKSVGFNKLLMNLDYLWRYLA
jgi:hypothetical protein